MSKTESDSRGEPDRVTLPGLRVSEGRFSPEPLPLRAASAGTQGPHRDDAGRGLAMDEPGGNRHLN